MALWLGLSFPKGLDVSKQLGGDDAKKWSGWHTALKPSFEPIILARKPLSESTVAANVLKWGTGALNIDGTRIALGNRSPAADRRESARRSGNAPVTDEKAAVSQAQGRIKSRAAPEVYMAERESEKLGRWPANTLLTHDEHCVHVGTRRVRTGTAVGGSTNAHSMFGLSPRDGGNADADGKEAVDEYACVTNCPIRLLDTQSGWDFDRPAKKALTGEGSGSGKLGASAVYGGGRLYLARTGYQTSGGASRFFYAAKADASERWELCRTCDVVQPRNQLRTCHEAKHEIMAHPTVKPVDLMRYLIRLVAPRGALILDPFAGTGTTLDAARRESVDAIGIEQDSDNVRLARARLL